MKIGVPFATLMVSTLAAILCATVSTGRISRGVDFRTPVTAGDTAPPKHPPRNSELNSSSDKEAVWLLEILRQLPAHPHRRHGQCTRHHIKVHDAGTGVEGTVLKVATKQQATSKKQQATSNEAWRPEQRGTSARMGEKCEDGGKPQAFVAGTYFVLLGAGVVA